MFYVLCFIFTSILSGNIFFAKQVKRLGKRAYFETNFLGLFSSETRPTALDAQGKNSGATLFFLLA